jgi:hypothetical protein
MTISAVFGRLSSVVMIRSSFTFTFAPSCFDTQASPGH